MYELAADERFDIELAIADRCDDELVALGGGTYGCGPVNKPSGNFFDANLRPKLKPIYL